MSKPDVHSAAARGFERGAADYEKGRPGYPAGAIDTIVRECAIGAGTSVIDVGAGTGKFTRRLFDSGATVIGVEPVEAMRRAFVELFPGREIVEGTAEHLPLPDGSADVVTVAQAFHWFNTRPALDEIARTLRPGGWLVLIWNTRDEGSPWTAQLTEIMDRLAGDAPRFRSNDHRWRSVLDEHPHFGPLQSVVFDNPVPVDLELMLARVSSTSYVSALPDDERDAVLAEVTALLERGPVAEHGATFVERYRTELFWCRRT